MKEKSYIGDGVYASIEGDNLWLESGGMSNDRNRIALNQDNWDGLLQFAKANGLIFERVTAIVAQVNSQDDVDKVIAELTGIRAPDEKLM